MKHVLLNNAFDAVADQNTSTNQEYSPTVVVRTRRSNGQVQITVEDNGPGMPESVRARIFEPFFTTKPTGSGTGLGLSLSYDIVTQGHGGRLEVASELGKGSAFTVALPVSEIDEETASQKTQKATRER